MSGFFPPLMAGMVGSAVVYGLLPFAMALFLGLVALGTKQRRLGPPVVGLALLGATAALGLGLRAWSFNHPDTLPTTAPAMGAVEAFLPWTASAALFFVVVCILPQLIRAPRYISSTRGASGR